MCIYNFHNFIIFCCVNSAEKYESTYDKSWILFLFMRVYKTIDRKRIVDRIYNLKPQ